MFRLGANKNSIGLGYTSANNLLDIYKKCDGIVPLYEQLLTEFEEFLEIGTFLLTLVFKCRY